MSKYDEFFGEFVNALYDVREEKVKVEHLQLSQDELAKELNSNSWFDISLHDLLKDAYVKIDGDSMTVTPKAEEILFAYAFVPPKPDKEAVSVQQDTILKLEELLKGGDYNIMPIVSFNGKEEGVFIAGTPHSKSQQPLEDEIDHLSVAAVKILQHGGFGVGFVHPGTVPGDSSPGLEIYAIEGKPPRFDYTVDDCKDFFRGVKRPAPAQNPTP